MRAFSAIEERAVDIHPDMSFDALAIAFKKMAEVRRKQMEHEKKLIIHDEGLSVVEARVESNSGKTGFFTIRGFCNLKGIRINRDEAGKRGKAASSLSRKQSIIIGRVPDETHGTVNTYHESVLCEVFKDVAEKRSS